MSVNPALYPSQRNPHDAFSMIGTSDEGSQASTPLTEKAKAVALPGMMPQGSRAVTHLHLDLPVAARPRSTSADSPNTGGSSRLNSTRSIRTDSAPDSGTHLIAQSSRASSTASTPSIEPRSSAFTFANPSEARKKPEDDVYDLNTSREVARRVSVFQSQIDTSVLEEPLAEGKPPAPAVDLFHRRVTSAAQIQADGRELSSKLRYIYLLFAIIAAVVVAVCVVIVKFGK